MAGDISLTKALLIDRDGVINVSGTVETGYHILGVDAFKFEENALDGLCQLTGFGWPIIVITNQSCIGRQLMSEAELDRIHTHMIRESAAAGARIVDVFYCGHTPKAGCDCRKPAPGLLKQAAEKWKIDLKRSWFIGDSKTDKEAADAVGCRFLGVRTGRGKEWPADQDWVVNDLLEAATMIWREKDA